MILKWLPDGWDMAQTCFTHHQVNTFQKRTGQHVYDIKCTGNMALCEAKCMHIHAYLARHLSKIDSLEEMNENIDAAVHKAKHWMEYHSLTSWAHLDSPGSIHWIMKVWMRPSGGPMTCTIAYTTGFGLKYGTHKWHSLSTQSFLSSNRPMILGQLVTGSKVSLHTSLCFYETYSTYAHPSLCWTWTSPKQRLPPTYLQMVHLNHMHLTQTLQLHMDKIYSLSGTRSFALALSCLLCSMAHDNMFCFCFWYCKWHFSLTIPWGQ